MMNKELKPKWLKALRSGEYKQSRETLKDDNGFCCLGVLCDLTYPDDWVKNKIGQGIGKYHSKANTYDVVDYDGEPQGETAISKDAELAEDLLEEFGLSDYDQKMLIDRNDSFEWTFDKIADWIEKEL